MDDRARYAAAGALGAAIWGLQQPLDQRVGGSSYSDIELLGKLVSRRRWRLLGFGMHVLNGAMFGLLYGELMRRKAHRHPVSAAFALSLGEHLAMWPLSAISDRVHPAVRCGEHPRILTDPRAFGQGTWRHAIMGAVLAKAGSVQTTR